MRKSLFLSAIYLLLLLAACSKSSEIDCGCRVVTVENQNYRINICEDKVSTWERNASEKQARIQEKIDNCN